MYRQLYSDHTESVNSSTATPSYRESQVAKRKALPLLTHYAFDLTATPQYCSIN